MAKYKVEAREQLYYRFEVEADSVEEAEQLAKEYSTSDKDVYDADNYVIDGLDEQDES